jgi:two-component system phosphate regulon sensor histidine kinase PhoR
VLSSIEHDAEEDGVDMQKTNLENVLLSAVQSCKTSAQSKDISLHMICEDKTQKVITNIQLLEQALINLIDNAVKYSDKGTDVEVKAGISDQQEVVISVKDQGPGIPEKHQPRLFERFYRVDKGRSRKLGGTGLGLAIVKHIVTIHKGRVAVESEPGKGSTFFIFLPAPPIENHGPSGPFAQA